MCGFAEFPESSPISFSLACLGFVVQSLLFVYLFFMSLLIQGSEYRLEEYLKGMNWFMFSVHAMFEEVPKWFWGVSGWGLVLYFVP